MGIPRLCRATAAAAGLALLLGAGCKPPPAPPKAGAAPEAVRGAAAPAPTTPGAK